MGVVYLRARSWVAALCSVVALSAVAACAGAGVTRQEFVDHGLKVNGLVRNDEDRQRWRALYGCLYDRIAADDELVDGFMGLRPGEELPEKVAVPVSKALGACITTAGSGDGAGKASTTTTLPS